MAAKMWRGNPFVTVAVEDEDGETYFFYSHAAAADHFGCAREPWRRMAKKGVSEADTERYGIKTITVKYHGEGEMK